jgi:pyridoxal phosphate enzyme (YggS family)
MAAAFQAQGKGSPRRNTGSDVSGVKERIQRVRDRIARAAVRAGRDPASVTLIGAAKTVDVARVREAVAAGLTDVGENRVQEALPKIAAIGPGVRWHFIGHLQRNKARAAAGAFAVIHSVDTLRLAQALNRAARALDGRIPVLIEVNVAGEPTKHGVAPDAVADLLAGLQGLRHVAPVGLMTIAPPADDPETVRWVFRALRDLRDRLRGKGAEDGFTELSMGMSGDFEVAVEEGSTMVRVGRAIFGDR